jgi:tetratricopeptide (TPR) repeat protein
LGDEAASLADATRALEGTEGKERMELLMQRSELLQQLQRWKEAVDDWKEIRSLSDGETSGAPTEERSWSRAQLLNGLSYARALAHIELSEALLEATEALQEEENSAAILDTRGYILFLLGRRDEALTDLEKAVQLERNNFRLWRRIFEEQRQQLVDLSALRQMDQYYKRSLAVMLYHRALAYEKTEPEKAQRDYHQIQQELGFQPGPELF